MSFSIIGIITIIIIAIGVIDSSKSAKGFYKTLFFRPNNREEIDESIAYLKSKRPIRRREYQPDERLWEKYQNHFWEEPVLTELAGDILRHLGLPNNAPPVYVVDDMEGNAAGKYYGNAIAIKIQKYTRPNEIFAVLIHECMHYYLRLTGLGFPDVHKNEILTDTATIYFGFYDYIYSGYIHVGYIKESEIKYINNVLNQDE